MAREARLTVFFSLVVAAVTGEGAGGGWRRRAGGVDSGDEGEGGGEGAGAVGGGDVGAADGVRCRD